MISCPRRRGVEDEATLRALRRYGCNITQGFVHTAPLPAEELLRWIARSTRSFRWRIWRFTRTFGNLAFTRRGVEQLGSSLGS